MRVLFMMSSIAMGGGERILVSVLPFFKTEGITPALCTMNTRRDSPLTEAFNKTNIQRFDLGAKRMVDWRAWQRFRKLLQIEKFDVIHTQDQDTHIYGALAHWRLKTPVVMTRHVMFEPADSLKTNLRARLVLIAAHYGADRIVAVSEAVRQRFAKQARIPLSRIETIYNGIDIERFDTRSRRAAKRAELGYEATCPIVTMVAVLRAGKGHEVLFEAIPRLKAAVPNVQVKLVGDGELADNLRRQAAPLGDTVEFLGQRMDVPELLGASDVLVLPSWSEALPTVLMEAGAASLPVVATNVGGTAEIVVDGEGGYIVPPGDPEMLARRLIDLLQNPSQAAQMGQKARERVAQLFSLQQQARKTIALYERILRQ
ncbi:MAG: glycosyltransferase family 4 protein [Aggregatilineales bacterium]